MEGLATTGNGGWHKRAPRGVVIVYTLIPHVSSSLLLNKVYQQIVCVQVIPGTPKGAGCLLGCLLALTKLPCIKYNKVVASVGI